MCCFFFWLCELSYISGWFIIFVRCLSTSFLFIFQCLCLCYLCLFWPVSQLFKKRKKILFVSVNADRDFGFVFNNPDKCHRSRLCIVAARSCMRCSATEDKKMFLREVYLHGLFTVGKILGGLCQATDHFRFLASFLATPIDAGELAGGTLVVPCRMGTHGGRDRDANGGTPYPMVAWWPAENWVGCRWLFLMHAIKGTDQYRSSIGIVFREIKIFVNLNFFFFKIVFCPRGCNTVADSLGACLVDVANSSCIAQPSQLRLAMQMQPQMHHLHVVWLPACPLAYMGRTTLPGVWLPACQWTNPRYGVWLYATPGVW